VILFLLLHEVLVQSSESSRCEVLMNSMVGTRSRFMKGNSILESVDFPPFVFHRSETSRASADRGSEAVARR